MAQDVNVRAVITAKDDASSVVAGFASSVNTALDKATTSSVALAGAVAAAGAALYKIGIEPAAQIQTTVQTMAAMTNNTQLAQKAIGELYNFTLGKPIAFPDAAAAAKTLAGYGVAAQDIVPDVEALGKISIVSGAQLQLIALAFGQVSARGRLMGQDVLQLVNEGVPVIQILAKHFHESLGQVQTDISNGSISAQDFRDAMNEYVNKIDISKFSNTFQNRMISLQGSLRALAFQILGIKIDPIKGFTVEAGGLFDQLSNTVEFVAKHLRDMGGVIDFVKRNFAIFAGAILAGLIPAFVALASTLGLTNPYFLAFLAVGALIGGIVKLIIEHLGGWQDALKKLNPYITTLKDFINNDVIPALKDLYSWLHDKIAQAVLDFYTFLRDKVKPALDDIVDKITKVVTQLQNFFDTFNKHKKTMADGTAFMTGLKIVFDTFTGTLTLIKNQLGDFYKQLQDIFGPHTKGILEIFGAVILASVLSPILLLVAGIYLIVEAFNAMLVILNATLHFFRVVVDGFNLIWQPVYAIITEPFRLAWAFINGGFSGLIAEIGNYKNRIGSAFSGAWDTFRNDFKSAINFVIDTFNSFIGLYNRTIAKIPGAPHIGNLPHFASGVQNFSGGLALVGERGPELVQLPAGSNVIPNNKIQNTANTTININLNGPFMGSGVEARKYAQSIIAAMNDIALSKNLSMAQLIGVNS